MSASASSRYSQHLNASPLPLRYLGAALAQGALGWFGQRYFSVDGLVGYFGPGGGWALAVLLMGGRKYAWSLGMGGLVGELLAGTPLPLALLSSVGMTLSALLGHWLLRRDARFDAAFLNLRDYRQLLLKAAVLAPGPSALLGISGGTALGLLQTETYGLRLLQWWAGIGLGVMLVTPLVMTLLRGRHKFLVQRRGWETLLVLLTGALLGQFVLLDWLPQLLPLLPRKAYWLFPLVVWTAVRLGLLPTLLFTCITTVQAMSGLRENYGFFANSSIEFGLLDRWSYISTLSLVGITLAVYFKQRERDEAELRIAATAFECQEGMIITDAKRRILRTNQSFTRITGYSQEDVLGQTTAFMRADRQPASFYDNAWRTAREQGFWSDEVWHRRKNGEIFPQWLTATAVKDAYGEITNYVVTHIDISYRKQREAEVLAGQLEQRDALVREVHHRIKNNLQGITGLLRQFAQSYPETADPINQAIGRVRSIAVIHGLQGRSSERTVRLCELTSAIAGDISAVWQVPVRVDIPSPWTPCIIDEAEAVPLALVLNELIINAVKHGSQQARGVEVRLRKGEQADHVQVRISNTGSWQAPPPAPGNAPIRGGLQLIEAMLPRSGAQLLRDEEDGMIHVWLMLTPPVITLETARNTHVPDPDTQSPAPAG
jgi:PAS domain S-box-containing protein